MSRYSKKNSESLKRKDIEQSVLADISRTNEQRRQRDERAARRALESARREAKMKAEEAQLEARRKAEKARRIAEEAQLEADRKAADALREVEVLHEHIENELKLRDMKREAEIEKAKELAWDEISQNSKLRKVRSTEQSVRTSELEALLKEQKNSEIELNVSLKPCTLGKQSFAPQPCVSSLKLEKVERRLDSYVNELPDVNVNSVHVKGPPDCSYVPPAFQQRPVEFWDTVPCEYHYPPPRPEIIVFDGDPLNYNSFVASFQTHITRRIESDNARLTDLLQHCNPFVKSQIDHFVETPNGFGRAWEKLYRSFGRPLVVANRCEEKLFECPKLRGNDGEGLRRMASIMEKAIVQLEGIESFSSLNSLGTLHRIVQKLPEKIQDKWIDWSFALNDEMKREVTFRDLVMFVRREAEKSSSVFGKTRASSTAKTGGIWQSKSAVTSATVVDSGSSSSSFRKNQCKMCGNSHHLSKCEKYAKLRYYKRVELVKRQRLCFRCLNPGHMSAQCSNKDGCNVKGCTSPTHHTLLQKAASESQQDESSSTLANSVNLQKFVDKKTLPQLPVLPVKVRNGRSVQVTHALLDSGSQQTFCTNKLADRLKAEGRTRTLQIKTMCAGENASSISGKVVNLFVTGLDESRELHLTRVLAVDSLPVNVQTRQVECLKAWGHLKDLKFTEQENAEVDLIIGIDHKQAFSPLDCRTGPAEAPDAIKTPLGWVLYGPMPGFPPAQVEGSDTEVSIFNVSINELHDGPPVPDPLDYVVECGLASKNSQEDRIAFKKMKDEVKFIDNHIQLPLLLRNSNILLPNNCFVVESRLSSLKRRFYKDADLHRRYTEVMESYFKEGFAEIVPSDDTNHSKVWYLPHQPVINPKKPEKLRVVFDCGAECKGKSLNKALMQGPTLINSLVGVLTRFREENVAVAADVKSMFHQVKVKPEHKDFLRFLWWPKGELSKKPVERRMTVHLFGAASSPSCAAFALSYATASFENEYSQSAVNVVKCNFYVDDMLMSAPSENEALEIIQEVKKMLLRSGFELAKWISSLHSITHQMREKEDAKTSKVIPGSNVKQKVLGVVWDIQSDEFVVKINVPDRPFAKRGMLSGLHSIYDPLGFVAKDLDCDEVFSEEEKKRWELWISSLVGLEGLSVKRCVKPASEEIESCELHHFADGSSFAYGAISFSRVVLNDHSVCCSFLMGKGYIAQVKRTVPQLELMGAVTAVRLDQLLRKELTLPVAKSVFWSDSTATLQSIFSSKKRFPVFSANRLAEIERCSDKCDWKYVSTSENPADDVTKGLTVDRFMRKAKWLSAPSYLLNCPIIEPPQPVTCSVTSDDLHVSNPINVLPVNFSDSVTNQPVDKLISNFSSLQRLKRSTAWLLRFGKYLKYKYRTHDLNRSSVLTVDEVNLAESQLIRYEQKRVFTKLYDALTNRKQLDNSVCPRSIRKFNPVMKNELIRVKGRLSYDTMGLELQMPILLPSNSHLTSLYVFEYHCKVDHCGLNHTFTALRERFWIEKPSSTIKRTLCECLLCRRLKAVPRRQIMADLPACRIETHCHPFSHTGVDVFGPIMVKHGRSHVKRYGCIFTCLSSRAIHLEIVHSMTADSFLMAFDRFRSRRGQVDHLYSDNGTNFVSASNTLKDEMKQWSQRKADESLKKAGVEWHFNAPYASHHGGCWES